MFLLPENVRFIIDEMKKNGERADIVGGCVRDFLLSNKPSDYDITTSATPEKTKKIFEKHRTVDTGIKHGTVTLILGKEPYEITTYRIDGKYSDNRHPENVTFSERIEDDLSRRDFTMNAIAYNPYDGVTDVFGGGEDIKNRVIRAVGDARRRFEEDALRILRGIRFSSTLGFKIEKETSAAIVEKQELLSNISKERIFVEWKKLLSGKAALDVIKKYHSVIKVFLPELQKLSEIPEAAFFEMTAEQRNITLFLFNNPDDFPFAMKRLKTDVKTSARGSSVLKCIASMRDGISSFKDSDICFLLRDFGESVLETAIDIAIKLGIISSAVLDMKDKLLAKGVPYRISDLAVSGKDLLARGFKGACIGEILLELQESVLRGEVENTKEALLASI